MLKHETFDLLVHSTDELEALLGELVAERRQLHSWPFSAVELLTTASGVRLIYKAQRTPTFEPDFYERVRSPLLPGYRLLRRDATYSTMVFEFVDAPLLRDMQLSEHELVGHGRAVVEAIGQIDEDVPVYIDISNGDAAALRLVVLRGDRLHPTRCRVIPVINRCRRLAKDFGHHARSSHAAHCRGEGG
jgi:hypothetical protein